MNQPSTPNSLIEGFPPLPRHEYCLNSSPVLEGYTAHQMHEYGQACVLADRAQHTDAIAASEDKGYDAFNLAVMWQKRAKDAEAELAQRPSSLAPTVAAPNSLFCRSPTCLFHADMGREYCCNCEPYAVPTVAGSVDVDELSNFIRTINGNNRMGAGALAENIAEWLKAAPSSPTAPGQQAQAVPEGGDPSDLAKEVERLKALLNSPELHDFTKGVVLEAAHQRERWSTSHDGGKAPADWFWLIGYLAQKAMTAQMAGDTDKALHHTISTSAAMANWHAAILGKTTMRPGIEPPAQATANTPEGK